MRRVFLLLSFIVLGLSSILHAENPISIYVPQTTCPYCPYADQIDMYGVPYSDDIEMEEMYEEGYSSNFDDLKSDNRESSITK